MIQLVTSDGTCPSGTVGAPDFVSRTAAAESQALVAAGGRKRAVVPIVVDAAAFTTPGGVPVRCTFRVQT